jgi:aspartyl-tRNA(Asn)/glutamyl-tRNA(Gln) amidotransferase subunit C
MSATAFSVSDVQHIAKLANIPISQEEEIKLAEGFTTTMNVVDELQKVNVNGVEPTHQVTDKENQFREDIVDEKRMFTQQQALQNAANTHEGYFVVPQLIDQVDP